MKSLLFFSTLLISTGSSFGCGPCELIPGSPNREIENLGQEIIKVTAPLQTYGATEKQTLNASCKGSIPQESQMLSWLDSNEDKTRMNAEVHGIDLRDESPQNIAALKYLLTSRDELGQDNPKAQQKFKSQCRKVICVVKELFGDTGLETLYLQRRYGFNASHFAYPNSVKWKKNELHSAMMGILDFPESHFPLWESRPFTRFTPGKLPSANYLASTAADASIRFFDRWASKSEGGKQQTSLHEIAHAIAGETQIDQSPEWRRISDWRRGNVEGVHSDHAHGRHTLVSQYGSFNALEDFAESVVAYRYNPRLLKSRSPEKYEYVKHTVFDGIEYTSELSCQRGKRISETLIPIALKGLDTWRPSLEEVRALSQECTSKIVAALSEGKESPLEDPSVKNCTEKISHRKGIQFMQESLRNESWGKFMRPMLQSARFNIPTNIQSRINEAAKKSYYHLRKEFVNSMYAVFSQKRIVPIENKCMVSSFEDSYRWFGKVYNETNGKRAYVDRHKIALMMSRFCIQISKARGRSKSGHPVGFKEMEKLFRSF